MLKIQNAEDVDFKCLNVEKLCCQIYYILLPAIFKLNLQKLLKQNKKRREWGGIECR